MSKPLSIIVLCDDSKAHAGTLREHLAAFKKHSRHNVTMFNTLWVSDARHLDLDAFDVVVIHYSLVITADGYLSPAMRERVRRFRGLKVQFLQDEYRWVDEITAMMRELEIDVLFSIVPPTELDAVYGGRIPKVEIVPTLAGYVPETLVGRRTPPLATRPLDIGYRGRVLPYWNGALSQEKTRIAQGVLARIGSTDLRYDIAWGENDRLYGRRWIRFLSSCRTTLGTESGTSITDFDGSIEAAVREHTDEHPGASFDEVSEAVLGPHEGNVMMNVVSPRLFEAAALRTAMVLFPGYYGGTVEPWLHYVPLEKDFSNFDEVVEAIRDLPALEQMATRTHEDVIASKRYSLATFVREFDDVVERRATVRGSGRTNLILARAQRPFTAGTIAGYHPAGQMRKLAQWYGTATLVATDGALRQLVRVWLGDRLVRRRVRFIRLAEDLLRLGLLRRAQAGRSGLLEGFSVSARRDASRDALVFVSHPADASPPESPDPPPAIGAARVLLWDHRQVGLLVHYRLPLRRWLSLAVGYYGVTGVHHFGALSELLRVHEQSVSDAIEPLLAAPPQQQQRERPATAEQTPRTDGRLRGALGSPFVRSPRSSIVKAGVCAYLLATNPAMRRLQAAVRRDPELRRTIHTTDLLEDIVKLHAVLQARNGRVPNVARVDALQENGTITFATRSEGIDYRFAWPELDRAQPPRRIIWDNREIGALLRCPTRVHSGLEVGAGTDGVYRFAALEALASRYPDRVWEAIAGE